MLYVGTSIMLYSHSSLPYTVVQYTRINAWFHRCPWYLGVTVKEDFFERKYFRYCGYCEYSQIFRGSVLRILRVLADISRFSIADTSELSVFRGSALLWTLSVLQVFQGSLLRVLQVALSRPLVLHSQYQYTLKKHSIPKVVRVPEYQ